MKKENILFLKCVRCKYNNLSLISFNKKKNEVKEGVILCKKCHVFYPIIEEIPILLDISFKNFGLDSVKQFFNKHKIFLTKLNTNNKAKLLEVRKYEQMQFFDEYAHEYDDSLPKTPFWNANDKLSIYRWAKIVNKSYIVVDFGCGSGRSTIPFALNGAKVLGFDISFEMIKKAKKNLKRLNLNKNTEFFVADCENSPFKDKIADIGIMFGVLHHISDPQKALNELSNALKKNGIYFGHENNKTIFRPFFDLLMKIWKIHEEKAGDHALISKNELMMWGESNFKIDIKTSTFLPPHFFNLFSKEKAIKLLELSDNIFRKIPIIRDHGGVLLIHGTKVN